MSVEICSVVIPVYNGAKYLRETIESILLQDYPAKELVLVDDASQDESIQILKDYQLRHPDVIRVITHTKNQGVTQAVISGIMASQGSYISACGQDDIMLEARLSTLATSIQRHGCSMVCSNAFYLLGETRSRTLVLPTWLSDRKIERREFLSVNPVIASSALFRREHFFRIDPSLFRYRNCVEWIHWFQYACMDGIYYLASPLVYYRKHGESLSNTIFMTEEYKDYKRFCRRHMLSRLTVREIAHAGGDYLLQRTWSKPFG